MIKISKKFSIQTKSKQSGNNALLSQNNVKMVGMGSFRVMNDIHNFRKLTDVKNMDPEEG